HLQDRTGRTRPRRGRTLPGVATRPCARTVTFSAVVYDRIVEATIREGQAPAVVVALQPGERLTSEAGAMMFISGDVSMDVEMPGGLMGGLKRKLLAGESLFLTRYLANGPGAV